MEELEPFGPRDPAIRDYILEFGTMVYSFGQLERALRQCVTVSNLLATNIKPPLPLHASIEAVGGKQMGVLIKAFERHTTTVELVRRLKAINQDRIKIIHGPRRLVSKAPNIDYERIREHRVYLREVRKRLLPLIQSVRLCHRNLLKAGIDYGIAETVGETHLRVRKAMLGIARYDHALNNTPVEK